MVKKMVTTYSNISSANLKVWASDGMVSIKDMRMLSEIITIRMISKARPLGVSDSNRMLYSFSFSSHSGFFII